LTRFSNGNIMVAEKWQGILKTEQNCMTVPGEITRALNSM
jgi:hypothetical protein